MTELDTLRDALREDAARHYGRRRRRLALPLMPALAGGLAALALSFVVLDLRGGGTGDEVSATPTPAPTVVVTTTPVPGFTPEQRASGLSTLAEATAVAPDSPALEGLLGGDQQIERAWFVPELKGHVILSRKDGKWCLSAPDPLTQEPDIERGSTCGPSEAIELGIGTTDVLIVPEGAKPPVLTTAAGETETLEPVEGGLVVIVGRPSDSRLTKRP